MQTRHENEADYRVIFAPTYVSQVNESQSRDQMETRHEDEVDKYQVIRCKIMPNVGLSVTIP